MEKIKKAVKRIMIRAIPTCTIWRMNINKGTVYLVIAPFIEVTAQEFLNECR